MNILEKENRPWGKFEIICDEKNFKLKKLHVDAGQRLSYQSHRKRSEIWTIVQGEALVIINGISHSLKYGDSIQIPLGAKHRVSNPSDDTLILIEVQTGTYFGEDDIIRYEDDYKRK